MILYLRMQYVFAAVDNRRISHATKSLWKITAESAVI